MASYRVIYNRKKKLGKDGKALVQIEVHQAGQRRYFSTEVSVSPDQWNEKKQEVKGNALANQRIRLKRQTLEDFELTFAKLHGRPFRLSDFDQLTAGAESAEPELTFTHYFHQQLLLDESAVEKGTHQRKMRVYNRLLEWHGKPLGFAELDYSLIVGFDQALRIRYKLDIETIRKVHQILKSYIERALKSGLLPVHVNPYEKFKAKRKESDKVILTEQEVKTLEGLDLSTQKPSWRLCLDAWLLCYYTTLRISDLTTLRPRHFVETEKGLQLEKKQEKTDRMVYIPLWNLHLDQMGQSKAITIVRRYWTQHDRPLFERSKYHLNKGFKNSLKLAGITKSITFHSARHTGITHLVKKMSVHLVQRIAGHTKLQTTMGYLHLSNQDVELALEQINW